MGGFRGLSAKNAGIDDMDVFCEGLEVMVYVLWVGDENIRDVGRTADGIQSDGGRNPIGRRTESDRTADAIWSGGERNPIGRRSVHDDNPPTSTPYTTPIKPIFIN